MTRTAFALLVLLGCSGGPHQAHELVDAGHDAGALAHIGSDESDGSVATLAPHDAGPLDKPRKRRVSSSAVPDAGAPDETADAGSEQDAAVSDAGHDAGRDAGTTHDAGAGCILCDAGPPKCPPGVPAFQCQ